MIIAVDFDGTIVEHDYPKIGKPIPFAIETLKKLEADGHRLLLWTVRTGPLLDEAVKYLNKKGIYFYAYNQNHPDEDNETVSRKLNADMFIDDRNIGGLPDWEKIYNAVRKTQDTGARNFNIHENRDYAYESFNKSRKKKNFLIKLGEMFQNYK